MKILVTGSSGFLGSNLIKRLDGEIVEFDMNHNKSETLDNTKLLKNKLNGVDLVYHLAGISNPQSPELYKVNVLGTKNLISAINQLNQDTKVIFASTFGVYKIPKKGEIVDEGYPINPRNEYGKSKLEAEKIILSNPKNIVMRFSNVYGPGMSPGRHSVIANFIDAIVFDKELEINDEKASRDFLYIDDLIDALVLSLKSNESGIYNICSGEETEILKLISMIEEITNKKAKVKINNNCQDSGNWRGSFAKAEKAFGWEPKVKIKKGLSKTISNII